MVSDLGRLTAKGSRFDFDLRVDTLTGWKNGSKLPLRLIDGLEGPLCVILPKAEKCKSKDRKGKFRKELPASGERYIDCPSEDCFCKLSFKAS